MNDLTLWNGSLELADLEPEQRICIEGFNRAIDMAEISFMEAGRCLCELKKTCRHGEFEALAGKHCSRLGKDQRAKAMKAYQEYRQNSHQCEFSGTVLGILAYAPDPQAALAEAAERKEAGEEITAKAAREIAAAQKRAEEAEAKTEAVQLELVDMKRRAEAAEAAAKPDQSRLIRELALMRKGGGISEGAAQAYSLLPEYLQRNILETLRERDRAQVDRQAAERTAAQAVANQQEAMAEAQQAKAERDEANRRAEEIAKDGAQGVIDELRAELETTRKKAEREREEAFLNGRKAGLAQLDEDRSLELADLREKLEASEKETNRLRRELTSTGGKLDLARREADSAAARARDAEERLDGASPVGKDAIHAGAIAHMNEDLKATIAKLEADCDRHERRLSDAALRTLQETLDGYFAGQETLEVAYDPIWTTVEEAMRDEGLED